MTENRNGMLTDILIVMDRDRRLTGFLRGQTGSAIAPPGFELNNPWRVRMILWLSNSISMLTKCAVGEEIPLNYLRTGADGSTSRHNKMYISKAIKIKTKPTMYEVLRCGC